jgi:DNA-directed RNA polymerase specialized sigma24 family protein
MTTSLEPMDLLDTVEDADASLWLYRDRTVALLRRYFRVSLQVGRLPSVLGRELLQFRVPVCDYGASTFEDTVIFVHDIDRCLEELDPIDHDLIVLIVLEERTQGEAARILHTTQRTVARIFPEALDQVSKIFLQHGILLALPVTE